MKILVDITRITLVCLIYFSTFSANIAQTIIRPERLVANSGSGTSLDETAISDSDGINNKINDLSYLRERVDNYWGNGISTTQKLELFDQIFDLVDQGYGAFINLDLNWDSIREKYRSEIENGVTKGRFAAILNYMSYALMDGHTYLADTEVSYGTEVRRYVPLFVVSSARDNSRFGACLTVLPDSTLLVLRVTPDHVLGLQPGDIILGYDNVLWKDLYRELIELEIPMHLNYVFGSTPESMTDVMLRSAGLNFHLFQNIDIKKYNGDVVHLPTSLLNDQTGPIWGNEQLPVPGVEMPDFWNEDYITWGIIDNTNIGYIYVASWAWEDRYRISYQFQDAIQNLMFNTDTDGMIVDMRLNYGGYMLEAHAGYRMLFNENVNTVHFDVRNDPVDHFSMTPTQQWPIDQFTIEGDVNTFYDKPIAVLTGPGAVSNGDWESIRLGMHPNARVFGKPTNGAYTINDLPDIGDGFYFTRAIGTGYIRATHEYMAHKSAPIDELVWFTPEDVANGTDTVVEAAVDWILGTTGIEDERDLIPNSFMLEQNYPNPFNPTTIIRVHLMDDTKVRLRVFNMLGQVVAELQNGFLKSGIHNFTFDANDLASGAYYYQVSAGGRTETKKMILIK